MQNKKSTTHRCRVVTKQRTPIPPCVHVSHLSTTYPRTVVCLFACLPRQYEKRFEKDDREKDRRKAREAMSDKIHMKLEFRQQVSVGCDN